MTRILAIDPGNTESGYALIDVATRRPLHIGKVANDYLADQIRRYDDHPDMPRIVIEMVASYGMPVGREVFETCVWIGRYLEISRGRGQLVYRKDVKLHHCGNTRAKDANITQALIDRFALNAPNRGKGTKAQPGWFYGFKADIWQAYALAVLVADATTPLVSPAAASPATAGEATTPQEVLFP